jgi:hypothetical protein
VIRDIAHYAQRTEAGATLKPPDKDEKSKQLAIYERKCKDYVAAVLREERKRDPA